AVEVACVDVDLDASIPGRNQVATLVQPLALGERPQLLKVPRLELGLRLVAGEPRAALGGQEQPVVLAAQPDLLLRPDRQVALVDLLGRALVELRWVRDQKLALDLHYEHRRLPTTQQGGSRASGLR